MRLGWPVLFGVLWLMSVTRVHAQIPGSEELCVVMTVADSAAPSVDSIHVVIQDAGLNEARPEPPDQWFSPRGLTMATGGRPSQDSLTLYLTVRGPRPLYVRTVRRGVGYRGIIGFYGDEASTREVELVEISCPVGTGDVG
jgi:hypothetical protein